MTNETLDRTASRPSSACRRTDSRLPHPGRATPWTTCPASKRSGPRPRQVARAIWLARRRHRARGRFRGVVGENLRRALDWLPQARKLLTVNCDVALPLKIEELAAQPRRERGCASCSSASVSRAGSTTRRRPHPRRRLRPAGASGPEPVERRYDALLEEQALAEWLKRAMAAALVGFDTETTGLDPMTAQLVGMSFCARRPRRVPAARARVSRRTGATRRRAGAARCCALAREPGHRKVGQNLKYDAACARQPRRGARAASRTTRCSSPTCSKCTSATTWTRWRSGTCGWKTISYDDVTGKGASRIAFAAVSVERATEYAAEDADCTLAVHDVLYPTHCCRERLQYVYETIEMPVLHVLLRMERNGVLLDAAKLEAQSHELGKEMLELEQKAYREAGQPFNLNSPKQIREILFERQKLPVKKKTPPGEPSTDEDVLAELAHDYPLPKRAARIPRPRQAEVHLHRQAAAHGATRRTGRVHTTYSQAVAVTGRLASQRSQPAEHPDPHAAGAAHPRGLHRAAGLRHRQRGLLADRAAHHGAPVGRRGSAARPSRGRRRAPGHRRGGLRRAARQGDRGRAAHRQDDQLRPDLRHERLRPGAEPRPSSAPPRRPTSTATSRATRA